MKQAIGSIVWGVILLGLACFWFVVAGQEIQFQAERKRQRIEEERERLRALEDEQDELKRKSESKKS